MEQKQRAYIISRVANGYMIRPEGPAIFEGDVYIAVTITACSLQMYDVGRLHCGRLTHSMCHFLLPCWLITGSLLTFLCHQTSTSYNSFRTSYAAVIVTAM